MSIASLQDSIRSCTMQKSNLTSRITTIMSRISLAASKGVEVLEETTSNKRYLADVAKENPEWAESTEYQMLVQEIDDDYALQMAEINEWEATLELEKNSLETTLNAVNTQEENWKALMKSNIKKDFTYGK